MSSKPDVSQSNSIPASVAVAQTQRVIMRGFDRMASMIEQADQQLAEAGSIIAELTKENHALKEQLNATVQIKE